MAESFPLPSLELTSAILTSGVACTLITCVWGFVLYIEYAVRVWRLTFRWSISQPLSASRLTTSSTHSDIGDCTLSGISAEEAAMHGASNNASAPSRYYYDASHWLFSVTLTVTLAELVVATIPKEPYLKLLAMVNPSMLFIVCFSIFLLDIAHIICLRAPFRISSVARGELVRPGMYTLLEDVIAVDLSQGYAFRRNFNECWEQSLIFRRLLYQLSIFWSLSGFVVSGACTIVIFTIDAEVGFAVGWGIPFLWAISWTAATTIVVGWGLSKEK